jgi:hypothetical protein
VGALNPINHGAMMERYSSFCKRIATGLDIAPLLAWISAIDFGEWPQQHRYEGELRPAMINDVNWRGFGDHARSFVSQNFASVSWRNPMLSVVMPGHFIPPHVDAQPTDWLFRVHVPLTTNPSACMFMDRAYHLEAGSAYKVNTEKRHAIVNHGETPRLHFMFDVHHG